jgi:uncharacterized 2Fe-2S/4Fe-4S cluster protein (DUF4445 family)
MGKVIVDFLPDQKSASVEVGTTILKAAHAAGAHINASCGGIGTCGQCKVFIEKGDYKSKRSEKLTDEEWNKGYRLACQTTVISDCVVKIPAESKLDRSVLKRKESHNEEQSFGLTAAKITIEEIFETSPVVVKRYVELSKPTIENNMADLSRLILGIKKQYDYEALDVDFKCLKNLAQILRKADWKVTAIILEKPGFVPKIIGIEEGNTEESLYGIAIDVGTTTLYVQLVDLKNKRVLGEASDYNPQISYGEDVITRILYAVKPGGLERLQEVVIKVLNNLINETIKEANIDKSKISIIVTAGNSTMTHLLLGLNPKYLREDPYVPTVNFFPFIRAKNLGFDVADHVYLYPAPLIASYVGGDIVAGVMACGIHQNQELVLFIDVGTNGEIVLGSSDWMVTASCSAGPAFEGGGVKYGMRATKGAIENVIIDRETLEPTIFTIGKVKPKGICGSGMINLIAELFETGIITPDGKFVKNLNTKRVREGENGYEYVLAWKDETQIGVDLVITEVDIDNIIRTKGAIYAGCSVLLKSVGLDFSNIDKFIIAGGFGSFINIEKAITIGLLPEIPVEKFMYVGNSSLAGARLIALSKDKLLEAEKCANMMTNIELSNYSSFMEEYVAALFLPHTNLNNFPGVMGKIKKG